MKHSFFAFVAVLLCCAIGHAQEEALAKPEYFTAHNKGKIFFYWGGNHERFTKSDIRFKGDDYDFKIYDVRSHDKPKGLHVDYINPTRMTIPQTNFRIGYFFTDKYNVSFGVDHMKYVMTQNQTVRINGTINNNSPFDGTYDHDAITLTEDFLKFEHTDGLNFINLEIGRMDDITKYFGVNTDVFQFNTIVAVGGGVLLPKTNTTLMGQKRHDAFHLSGYGFDAKVGINLTFFKYFFIQSELGGGYINMPNIRTTDNKSDSASQQFGFIQRTIALGGIFRL